MEEHKHKVEISKEDLEKLIGDSQPEEVQITPEIADEMLKAQGTKVSKRARLEISGTIYMPWIAIMEKLRNMQYSTVIVTGVLGAELLSNKLFVQQIEPEEVLLRKDFMIYRVGEAILVVCKYFSDMSSFRELHENGVDTLQSSYLFLFEIYSMEIGRLEMEDAVQACIVPRF